MTYTSHQPECGRAASPRGKPFLPHGLLHDDGVERSTSLRRDAEQTGVGMRQGIPVLADMAYNGAGEWVTTPQRRPPQGELTPTEQTVTPRWSSPWSGTAENPQ